VVVAAAYASAILVKDQKLVRYSLLAATKNEQKANKQNESKQKLWSNFTYSFTEHSIITNELITKAVAAFAATLFGIHMLTKMIMINT